MYKTSVNTLVNDDVQCTVSIVRRFTDKFRELLFLLTETRRSPWCCYCFVLSLRPCVASATKFITTLCASQRLLIGLHV